MRSQRNLSQQQRRQPHHAQQQQSGQKRTPLSPPLAQSPGTGATRSQTTRSAAHGAPGPAPPPTLSSTSAVASKFTGYRMRALGPRGHRVCPMPPLEPLKDGHRIEHNERVFLEAAERGDKQTVLRCLLGPRPVNVNCTNILGRSAIQIAVDNENVEIVELLLKQDGVLIGDALLYAIREGVYRIVEMLIDHPSISREMLGVEWSAYRRTVQSAASSSSSGPTADGYDDETGDYPPDVSPVMLAAHCNQFEILQLLLSRGARIVRPHALTCSCRRCRRETSVDSLRHSLLRIHTYRALSSPAWISLTSADPVLSAFRLSWELDWLAMRENEFKDLYAELSEQCKKYSCDLLDQCRSSEEVIAVLNKSKSPVPSSSSSNASSDIEDFDDQLDEDIADMEDVMNSEGDDEVDGEGHTDDETNDGGEERLTLARFKLALKYEQKQFVAHPHCQQLLASVWYASIPGWRRYNFVAKVVIIVTLIGLLPVMALIYLLVPRSRIGRFVRRPFMKFMYHSASFGVFLFLLILASTNVGSSGGDQALRQQRRGPPPTTLEWLIVFYVMGFVWSECKQLWEEGLKAYIRQWWNWLDFIMLSLYLCTFSLRLVAYFHSLDVERYGPNTLPRTRWPPDDPTLVSEGVFAIANVFSFARIIYLFQANPQLGPLQISLGCMLIDIGKFFFIFFLVITSFACGLNQLYYFYSVAPATTAVSDVSSAAAAAAAADAVTTMSSGYRAMQSVGVSAPSSTVDACNLSGQTVHLSGTNGDDSAFENAFDPVGTSFTTLFWTLFGLIGLTVLEIELRYIEGFGKLLFGLYNIAARILFLNMLIAMMSKSFNVTVDHADREWKFARSKLWMGYFDEGSTLPPPFNLIISPKSIYYFMRKLRRIIMCCFCGIVRRSDAGGSRSKSARSARPSATSNDGVTKSSSHNGNANGSADRIDRQKKYKDVMRRLVSRYILHWKKQMRQDGVSEDDLLEIKQDISSLRYELRDDRRRAEMQTANQVESLKRDILRLVGSASPHGIPPFIVGESPPISLTRSTTGGASYGGSGPAGPSSHTTAAPHHHVRPTFSHHSSAEREAVVGLGIGESPSVNVAGPGLAVGGGGAGLSRGHVGCVKCGAPGADAAVSSCPGSLAAPFPGSNAAALNAVKHEIAASLRADIRELVHEMAAMMAIGHVDHHALMTSSTAEGLQQLGSPSALGSDLYQTHLYTQL